MVGQTLGSYRIISEIGKGGMGVVYLAEHTLLGRKAAVKLLRSDVAADQVERFFNEAKAAATLHHPGLVDVFDFGHHTDGSAYIVMEFLPGESLAERLERDPRLPVGIACTIARAVASALHVAHELGIVHRDLKPGNIFLVPDPEAPIGIRTKVLDFGIAKLARDREPRSVKTHSGAVIGTPRYMSPEQCKNARNVDGRSDIYSLGCILYEMLLGVAPFDYDSWGELVGAHLHEEPPRPTELDPALPKDVETLLIKMLEKNPNDRFQSMQELAQSLEVLLREHGGGTRLTPPTGVKPVARDKRASDPTLPASGDEAKTPSQERKIDEAARKARARAESAPTLAPGSARRVPWVAIGSATLGVGGLAIAAVLVLGKDKGEGTGEPAYIVVDQRGSESQGCETPVTPEAIDAGIASTKPVEAAVDAGVRVTKPPTATDAEQLQRAFNQQRSKVASCFRAHPSAGGEELSVRFHIDARGKVITAEVLPSSVGNTPLGSCLQGVARETTFGPQPKGVTFRVPILTRGG
jgi:serine/threonine-protein kinase